MKKRLVLLSLLGVLALITTAIYWGISHRFANQVIQQWDDYFSLETQKATALSELDSSINMQPLRSRAATLENIARLESQYHNELFISVFFIAGFTLLLLYHSKKANDEMQDLKTLLMLAPNAIVIVNSSDGKIDFINQLGIQLFKFDEQDTTPRHIEELVPTDLREKHKQHRKNFLTSERAAAMDPRGLHFFAQRSDGEKFPVNIAISTVVLDNRKKNIAVIRDLTPNERLKAEANTDSLTQLLNRQGSLSAFENILSRSRRYKIPTNLIMIDIDYFKDVNDRLGHERGDMVIKQIARILAENSRDADVVCRWGGEEFLIVAPDISHQDAIVFAEKLRALTNKTFHDLHLPVTISLGVTQYQNGKDTLESLLERADQAVHAAKYAGRNRVNAL